MLTTVKQQTKTIFWLGIAAVTLLSTLILGGVQTAAANDAQAADTMRLGNQLYVNGHYDEAARLYQQLIDQGIESSDLYFNLANAYLQQGELGEAIVNFERVAELNPRDAAVQANLDYARSQVVDRNSTEGISPIYDLVESGRRWLTVNEMAWLTLILWYAVVGLILFLRHAQENDRLRQTLTMSLVVVGLMFAASATMLGGRVYFEQTSPAAVVVADEIEVRREPNMAAKPAFKLSEGADIALLDVDGEWAQISLPSGELVGWVDVDQVEAINS